MKIIVSYHPSFMLHFSSEMETSSSAQAWKILCENIVEPRCSWEVSFYVISLWGIHFWSSQKAEIQAWLRQKCWLLLYLQTVICKVRAALFSPRNVLFTLNVFVSRPACLLGVCKYLWLSESALTLWQSTPSRADERTEQVKWNQRLASLSR